MEIALKYEIDYETKHQTNSQILQQQDNFDLNHQTHQTQPNKLKFKRIQALLTLSISVPLTKNKIPSHTCHCQRLMKTTYLLIKLIAIQNFRNRIYENTSAKMGEKEPRISVKILMQRRNLLRQEIRQEEGSSLNIQESKMVENSIPKVTILTNSKTEKGENREKEVIVTETGSQKLSSCQSLGTPNCLFKGKISEDKSELISNSRKRKNNTSEVLDANLSPIKRIGLTKVHQSSTPARTMFGSAIQTISPIPDHLYTSMASEPFVLPGRYDKQDILEPYSLVKSWNAIQWNTGQEQRGIG